MSILPAMERKKLPKPAQVRTVPAVHNDFRVAVQRLALSRRARILDGGPTQETVTSALWIWFSRLDPSEAESFLAQTFPLLEAAIAAHESEASPGAAVLRTEVRRPPPKERKRKGAG